MIWLNAKELDARHQRSRLMNSALLPVAALQDRAHEAAGLLKALANPDRLMLLCQLVEGELGVNVLGERAGLVQPSLSQQLRVLREERLVATRREGKQVLYRIASSQAMAVLATLHSLYCTPPDATAWAGGHRAFPIAD